jgi:hypothetical protein
MSYKIEVDREARIAYVTGSGRTNASEGHAVLVELAAHPEFEPGFGLVWDLRELEYEPSADDMMAGFANVVSFRPVLRNRMAILVGAEMEMPSELSAALYETEGFETQVFWELDEASEWVKETCAAAPQP